MRASMFNLLLVFATIYDCQKNTNCAYRVYKEQGYNAWYGYQYHKSECDNYQVNC